MTRRRDDETLRAELSGRLRTVETRTDHSGIRPPALSERRRPRARGGNLGASSPFAGRWWPGVEVDIETGSGSRGVGGEGG